MTSIQTLAQTIRLAAALLVLAQCSNADNQDSVVVDVKSEATTDVTDQLLVDTPVRSDAAKVIAQADTYTVYLDRPEQLAPGKKESFLFFVEPADGWKMNREFPSQLKPADSKGISVQVSDDSVVIDTAASFHVDVTANAPGESALKVDMRFAMCTDTTCDPKQETFTIPIVAL